MNTGTFSNGSSAGLGMITHTQYDGGFIYKYTGASTPELTFFSHPEGYIEPDNQGNYDYVYQYKDHLGNIRLSYKNVGTSTTPVLDLIEEKNYYPFGLKHKGYNNATSGNVNSVANKFGYNGKELNESLDLNVIEMDWRQYDPAIARWTGIDPVTHWSMSTYTAFDNNPVFWSDPSGADSVYNFDTGQYVIDGKEVSFEEAISYANSGGNADGSNNNNVADENSEGCKYCIKVSSYSEGDVVQYERLDGIVTNDYVGDWQVEAGSKESLKALKVVLIRKLLGKVKLDMGKDGLAVLIALIENGDIDIRSRVVNATVANMYSAYGDVYFNLSTFDFIFEETGRSETRNIILQNTNTTTQSAIFDSNTGKLLLDISNSFLDNSAAYFLRSKGSVENFD